MTLSATAFVLKSLETGAVAAIGLLCLDARYVAVQWTSATRIDRRFATPAEWKSIESELSSTPSKGPLPAASTTARLLAEDRSVSVEWMWTMPVPADDPAATAQSLDALLRQASPAP